MLDPMVEALAESIAQKNGWGFAKGTSADGKNLSYLAFKIKGINIFIEEGATMKVFPAVAVNKVKREIDEYESRCDERHMDILGKVKLLNDVFGKEKI